jgi:membrane protein YqaA with SNARE-associated domain
MPDPAAHGPLLLCLLTLVVAVIGSLLPLSPIEPLLLAVAASVPAPFLLPVVVLATVGHMAAKTLLYMGGHHAERAVPERRRATLRRVRALVSRHRSARCLTVLVSAFTGTPPFYLVTICCGALRIPLSDYLVAGTIGRGLRFAAFTLLPRFLSPLGAA